MTDYIPTTEEMRKIFSEFDSWLEQHDQEVATKTMAEYHSQHSEATVRTQSDPR